MKKRTILGISLALITIIGMLGLTACGDDVDLYSGLNLEDYIKPAEYKGIEADKMEVKVTKAEIGDAIVADLKAAAKETKLKKGDKVKEGATVNIDYVGKMDGKEFEGGSAEGYDLTLGTGKFIDGFRYLFFRLVVFFFRFRE